MSKNRSQTIQIYLPTGNPRGIRRAERTSNSNIHMFEIPRTELSQFYKMNEAAEMGIYFLVGESKLYIGQTSHLGTRLKKQDRSKKFWQKAFVVALNNNFRTLDHLYCLERLAIECAQEVGNFELENSTGGNEHRHLNESIRSDCENIFDEIEMLLLIFNQSFFEKFNTVERLPEKIKIKLESNKIDNFVSLQATNLFYCGVRGEEKAVGFYKEKSGFVLCRGSILAEITHDISPGWLETKRQWIKDNILVEDNSGRWRLKEDCLVSTPSMAAALVLGRPTNGWTKWKNENGQMLDEIYERPNNKILKDTK